MGNAYFNNAGNYLIDTLFSLYIGAIILRFLFQLLDVDYHNPITQFLVKITSPLCKPLQAILPKTGNLDLASLLLAFALTIVKFYLKLSVTGQYANIAGIAVFSIADMLSVILTILLWAMIIRVILSWINPDPRQPVVQLLIQLTEPLMAPARRMIPPIGGLDLSPIAVFILISLTRMLAVAPLMDFATTLM
jgi:YggT family protein